MKKYFSAFSKQIVTIKATKTTGTESKKSVHNIQIYRDFGKSQFIMSDHTENNAPGFYKLKEYELGQDCMSFMNYFPNHEISVQTNARQLSLWAKLADPEFYKKLEAEYGRFAENELYEFSNEFVTEYNAGIQKPSITSRLIALRNVEPQFFKSQTNFKIQFVVTNAANPTKSSSVSISITWEPYSDNKVRLTTTLDHESFGLILAKSLLSKKGITVVD